MSRTWIASRQGRGALAVAATCAAIVVGAATAAPDRGRAARPTGAPAGSAALAAAPDLTVRRIDRAGLIGDWQTLAITGSLGADVTNRGDAPAGAFTVAFFADRDGDGRLDRAADELLGVVPVGDLAAGASVEARAAISGTLAFRDGLIHALADAGDAVPEGDEANNRADSGALCAWRPPPRSFAPALEWEWPGSKVLPEWNQVLNMPLVVDLTGDGLPEVVFSTFRDDRVNENGRLRAVRGDTGAELFTVTDPALAVYPKGSLAAGDLDGDGRPEILTTDTSGERILAFGPDGAPRWRSAPLPDWLRAGGPALADLDGDGQPEIVAGHTVLNADGSLRWTGWQRTRTVGNADGGQGPLAIVADLDGDDRPEVVAGNVAFDGSGQTRWERRELPDGFNAVADFDGDGRPEVVLVGGGRVWLLAADGRTRWGPVPLAGALVGDVGGPPTVADMDGDGRPEIGVAGGSAYTALGPDGDVRWSYPTQDLSSRMTGSTVFDFEGDGRAEVVYGDELALRIFAGPDGEVLWQTQSPSGTTYELPVVADVDADGNAEIVKATNNYRFPGPTGIQVYGDANDTWVPTRRIWNQHAYHVTNIADDATVPRREPPSWRAHNTYRQNLPVLDSPFAAPDLTAARLVIDTTGFPDRVTLTARIGNGGALLAPPGVSVAFYAGDPAAGGRRVATTTVPSALPPGAWADVTVDWPGPPPGGAMVHVVADDDGTGRGQVSECDETNNHHQWPVTFPAPPTATPTTTPVPTATPTATPEPRPIYLPLLLKEQYEPKRRPVDVVLVLDASSSMDGAKLAAAIDAARAFAGALRPPPDQVAVVTFDAEASVLVPLGAAAAALDRALATIAPRRGTRIDRGLGAARVILAGPAHRAANRPVIVLLSDGGQYEEPDLARGEAAAARSAGVTVFTIGLGADVDGAFLAELAGATDRYYFAPSPDSLRAIYLRIATLIPCDPRDFWGGRCGARP